MARSLMRTSFYMLTRKKLISISTTVLEFVEKRFFQRIFWWSSIFVEANLLIRTHSLKTICNFGNVYASKGFSLWFFNQLWFIFRCSWRSIISLPFPCGKEDVYKQEIESMSIYHFYSNEIVKYNEETINFICFFSI